MHPVKHPNAEPADNLLFQAAQMRLNEIKEVVGDESRRALYNSELDLLRQVDLASDGFEVAL